MIKKIKEKMINGAIDLRNRMIGMLFLFLTITGVIYIFVWLFLVCGNSLNVMLK